MSNKTNVEYANISTAAAMSSSGLVIFCGMNLCVFESEEKLAQPVSFFVPVHILTKLSRKESFAETVKK